MVEYISDLEYLGEAFFFNPEVARMIKELWRTTQIREVYRRQSEFQLPDSAAWLVCSCV